MALQKDQPATGNDDLSAIARLPILWFEAAVQQAIEW